MCQRLRFGALLCVTLTWAATVALRGQLEDTFFDGVDHPAIAYRSTPTHDAVANLARDVAAGTARLDVDATGTYLRDLLRALDVPVSSQIVTFGKTSLQAPLISATTPRAVYFNDTTAVAWPAGGFIEIAAQDPTQGMVFYVLDPRQSAKPAFVRQGNCLTCHVAYATLNVPGVLVRSVAAAANGQILPHVWNGTTSHRTPPAERWAGWFVTGNSGATAHFGNQLVTPSAATMAAERSALPSLADRIPTARYLSTHSDIAALLVFDHQMHGMNLLTRVGWEVRVALADQPALAAAVAARLAVDVVDYFLFVDEAALKGPLGGSSGFAAQFAARGPRGASGRSLRELDLTTRLLRYPCSYLVYTPAFDALPTVARDAVYARLWRVLSGSETGPRYLGRTRAERQAIVEILRETKAGLPTYFQGAVQ